MEIFNLTKNTFCARHLYKAETFSDRLTGMIGKDFSKFDGMLFDRCNAIHSCFMRIPLDVIFLSGDKKVLKTVRDFPPWKLFLACKNSYYVIELPSGTIERSRTEQADQLTWEVVPDRSGTAG